MPEAKQEVRTTPPDVSDKDQVRRNADWVTIDLVEYERQRADEARWQAYLRSLDPDGYGHWGPTDDDE
jgi:hypothetical protein